MPLDGSDVASKPAGTTAAPNTTIESAKYNSVVNDIYAILNTVRTLAKGFTGASTAIGALDNFNTASTDIASAATTDLSTATGVAVTITGTTTITSFGTCNAGVYRVLTFESALTITHGANIVLPGDANLSVAAGDIVVMRSEGSGVWHLENHQPKAGFGSISSQNANAVAITGGSISGIADLAVADGGTGASTAAAARTALFGVSSTTDNALARYDGTTGALQNSGVTVDDSGNMTVSGSITADGNKVAEFYSGTTAGTTNFPVGQHLMIFNVAPAPNRMATCSPCLHASNSAAYVLSGNVNAGTALAGTWHSIGYDSGANILFVQRTA